MVKTEVALSPKEQAVARWASHRRKEMVVAWVVAAGVATMASAGWWFIETHRPSAPEAPVRATAQKPPTVEELVAKRAPTLPPRAPGEVPPPSVLVSSSTLPTRGVEVQEPQRKPHQVPVKVMPQKAPTPEMNAAAGAAGALSVDADGYATLPNGERVKVTMGAKKLSPVVPTLAGDAMPMAKTPATGRAP